MEDERQRATAPLDYMAPQVGLIWLQSPITTGTTKPNTACPYIFVNEDGHDEDGKPDGVPALGDIAVPTSTRRGAAVGRQHSNEDTTEHTNEFTDAGPRRTILKHNHTQLYPETYTGTITTERAIERKSRRPGGGARGIGNKQTRGSSRTSPVDRRRNDGHGRTNL